MTKSTTIHRCSNCDTTVEVTVHHSEDCEKSTIVPNVLCTSCEEGGLMNHD